MFVHLKKETNNVVASHPSIVITDLVINQSTFEFNVCHQNDVKNAVTSQTSIAQTNDYRIDSMLLV